MRLGHNPARYRRNDNRHARVTVCVLVSIPEQFGYFEHRFDVLRTSLASIIDHTDPERYDLLVFDNASCPEVVDYLRSTHKAGIIRYLFLSNENLGAVNAHKMMFPAAPGEIIAYGDDDVLYGPGWLDAHLEILEAFPRAGMISGSPVRERFVNANQHLQSYLDQHPEVSATSGRFIPEQWNEEFRLSTSRPAKRKTESEKERRREGELTEIMLECRGVKAYSQANHFQFVAPKAIILQGLAGDWERRYMAGLTDLDARMDALGYARLSTIGRYARHMGNVVTKEFLNSVPDAEMLGSVKPWSSPAPVALKLAQTGVARAALSRLNNWSYALLKHPK